MGFAGRKVAAIDPVAEQITVVVGVSGDIEMYGSAQYFVSVGFDGCDLSGMFVDFYRNRG